MTYYVSIFGATFSGTTMLSLMLDSHPDVAALGEWKSVASGNVPKRVCKFCGPEPCPIWTVFRHSVISSSIPSQVAPDDVRGSRLSFARRWLARWADARVLVDSTKQVPWVRANRQADPDRHVLVLIYKPPGLQAASYIKRGANSPFGYTPSPVEAARRWAGVYRRGLYLAEESERRGSRVHLVDYTDLIDDPMGALTPILRSAGLESRPYLWRYWQFEHHLIGGNSGARHAKSLFVPRETEWLTGDDVSAIYDDPIVEETFDRLGTYEPA